MAELGSHQLDACSIFLGKVHPLAVTGVGTHSFYGFPGNNEKPNPREIDDHVFATYEFPGKHHPKGPNGGGKDENDVVVVTYSSISTNGSEQYGECVMGDRGTMIVEAEQSVMIYPERDPNKKGGGPPRTTTVAVTGTGDKKPAMESGSTWGGPAATAAAPGGPGAPAGTGGPVSRGYREEMEDFAYCIKMWKQGMSGDRRTVRG